MYIPYKLKISERKLIVGNYKTYKDWKKTCFDEIKKNIKLNLYAQQGGRCSYCKSILDFAICDPHLDHILDKKNYEKFGFHTKNLTLTCPKCNNKKSTKDAKARSIKKNYPSKTDYFKIYHPYYDRYEDHLYKVDDLIISWHSDKGLETIKMCNLDRVELVFGFAKEKSISKLDLNSQLLIALTNAYDPKKEKEVKKTILDAINNLNTIYIY